MFLPFFGGCCLKVGVFLVSPCAQGGLRVFFFPFPYAEEARCVVWCGVLCVCVCLAKIQQ